MRSEDKAFLWMIAAVIAILVAYNHFTYKIELDAEDWERYEAGIDGDVERRESVQKGY